MADHGDIGAWLRKDAAEPGIQTYPDGFPDPDPVSGGESGGGGPTLPTQGLIFPVRRYGTTGLVWPIT